MASALDMLGRTVRRAKRPHVEKGLEEAQRRHTQVNRFRKAGDRVESHPVSGTGQALLAESCEPQQPVVCFDQSSIK